MTDRPLSYWTTVARMGFENDLHRLLDGLAITRAELAERVGASPAYITKVLNGTAGNFQLKTIAKWARAIGAIVQIRLIKDGEEVVRVVDYETARRIDSAPLGGSEKAHRRMSESTNLLASITNIDEWLEATGRGGYRATREESITMPSERVAK